MKDAEAMKRRAGELADFDQGAVDALRRMGVPDESAIIRDGLDRLAILRAVAAGEVESRRKVVGGTRADVHAITVPVLVIGAQGGEDG